MRVGLELELWSIDDNGELAGACDLVEDSPHLDAEFVTPLIEVQTAPCDSGDELITELVSCLAEAIDVAEAHGRRLVPLGTPLVDEQIPYRSNMRTQVQRGVLGDEFTHAAHCAGTHLHVEQVDPVSQLRILTALDPAIALVTTSPYYRSEQIAACARPLVYRRRCYRSLPTHGRLWAYPDTLEEWRTRRDRRFEVFVQTARDAGFPRETVESTFSPEDALWSPVRLRDDLGTVEWRAPDACPPSQLIRLVPDVIQLVERAVEHGTRVDERGAAVDDSPITVPPFEQLLTLVDSAIDEGLSSSAVVDHVSGLGLSPEAYRPIGNRIAGSEQITQDRARRIRCRLADRLEREVQALTQRVESHQVSGIKVGPAG